MYLSKLKCMEGGQYAVKEMQLINDLFSSMTVLYHVNYKLKRVYMSITLLSDSLKTG